MDAALEEGAYALSEGKTLGGREIMLAKTDAENYVRHAILSVQNDLKEAVLGCLVDSEDVPLRKQKKGSRWKALLLLVQTALALAPARTEQKYYEWTEGGASPQLYVDSAGRRGGVRIPIYPNPQFTHLDLLEHIGSRQMREFRRELGVPSSAKLADMVAASGLLECDWAVAEMERENTPFASYLLGRAHDCLRYIDALALSDAVRGGEKTKKAGKGKGATPRQATKPGRSDTNAPDRSPQSIPELHRYQQSIGKRGGDISTEVRRSDADALIGATAKVLKENTKAKGGTLVEKVAAELKKTEVGLKRWPGKKLVPESTVYKYMKLAREGKFLSNQL